MGKRRSRRKWLGRLLDIKPAVKLGLAVLLLVCVADMPYGFYTLVRFVAAMAFIYLAYGHFKAKDDVLGFVFVALALLFQPFVKLSLGRMLWNVVDVIVAIALVCLVVRAIRSAKRKA